jgi:hypothetical protein
VLRTLAPLTENHCENNVDRVSAHYNHLRTVVREYVAHYHTERNHQGLEGRLIEPPANAAEAGQIVCRERIGGLLCFYHRQAA